MFLKMREEGGGVEQERSNKQAYVQGEGKRVKGESGFQITRMACLLGLSYSDLQNE